MVLFNQQTTEEEIKDPDDELDAATLTKALLNNQVDLPLIYQTQVYTHRLRTKNPELMT